MSGQLGIIACDIIRSEVERVIGDRDIPLKILDFSLHVNPKEMPGKLNEEIRSMTGTGCGRIALGYGLCCNGTVGVGSGTGLVMPRCHDCVSMLLGSTERYYRMFNEYKGTLFLSDGQFRCGLDPLTVFEEKYVPRLGEKKALKGLRLEYEHYKTACLINNGVGNLREYRERARANAALIGLEYMETEAGLGYFEGLIDGPRPDGEYISISAGEKIQDSFFFNGNPLSEMLARENRVQI